MAARFSFDGKVWKDPKANWYFVSLDNVLSEKIKTATGGKASKYGLIKTKATVGGTSWDTRLFPSKTGNYVIAVKSVVRKKENIRDKDFVKIKLVLY